MYAANSCGLRKPLLSVSSWLNKLMGAGAEVEKPVAGTAETLPPAGIAIAGAGAGAV
jgi:hypothetical protein